MHFENALEVKKIWFVMLASLFRYSFNKIKPAPHLSGGGWKFSLVFSINSATRTTFDHLVSLSEQFSARFRSFSPPANANNERVYVICDLFLFIIRKNCLTSSSSSSFRLLLEKKLITELEHVCTFLSHSICLLIQH